MIEPRKRRINWYVVIQGVVLFCIQLPFLPPTIEFVRTSEVVSAKVIALNAGGKHPQVVFTTPDGQRISVPASSFFHSVEVGDTVEMRYDPREPQIAEMNTLFGVWGIQLVFGWLSACLILGGLLGLSAKGSEFEASNDKK
ncbi:DUF3592 domain-containing protein [Caballeronia sp. INDeC2]|uniref:DUF3592 domain-containing protein n=1 Tax=Caballeronia sp. INDeC2 TaxID=2921747 RepID=UPI00202966F7|nr:DUF3592 domain-containing protein [Caballeronia sp. INDeC2]